MGYKHVLGLENLGFPFSDKSVTVHEGLENEKSTTIRVFDTEVYFSKSRENRKPDNEQIVEAIAADSRRKNGSTDYMSDLDLVLELAMVKHSDVYGQGVRQMLGKEFEPNSELDSLDKKIARSRTDKERAFFQRQRNELIELFELEA